MRVTALSTFTAGRKTIWLTWKTCNCYIWYDMSKVTRLYLDMDGVLVDFDSRVDEFGARKAPGKNPDAIDWNIAREIGPDFWANMKWMPGADKFYEDCRDLCHTAGIEMGILTAMEIPAGIRGKCLWVHWNTDLDNEHLIIVRKGEDKMRFAAPGRILVDDTPKNIEGFRGAGGLGVLYKNPQQALEDIVKLL